jgi:hypothetical protein
MSVLSITFTGEDGRPLTALHTVLVICSHVHTPSSKKKRRMCSTHEFPLPNQDSPPSIHQSNILRPLFEHPPSSPLLTSHKNLQTSRSTERSARTDQGDNRLRSGEKKSVRGGRNPALIQKPSQLDRFTTKYLQDIIDTV